jgi:hypothetical protein
MSGFLLHFLLGFKENGAIFSAVVGFTSMVHAVRGFRCVWASATTATTIWGSTSLAVWGGGIFDRRSFGFFPAEMV